jgi:nitroimidazol reductase NimA-like FMN-containing flavoprotein (pyridoxamine 5'-phosphate oxidase superfamily)
VTRHSFCVLATSSANHLPHAVGLLYAAIDLDLYLLVDENSIKVRNVRENPRVAVCVPVRKYPPDRRWPCSPRAPPRSCLPTTR